MKKLKVKVGDIFAIPIGTNGEFFIGKVLAETNLNGYLVEIYRQAHFKESEVDIDALGSAAFNPLLLSFQFSDIEKWPILGNSSGDHLKNRSIKFGFRDPPAIWENGTVLPCTRQESEALDRPEVWFPERLLRRLKSIGGL